MVMLQLPWQLRSADTPPTQGLLPTLTPALPLQFTSSAIVNAPPPPIFIKLLHRFDKAGTFDKPHTRKKQLKIFRHTHPEKPKVVNLRCTFLCQAAKHVYYALG